MDRDTLQENRFAIKQNLLVASLDGTETNRVGNHTCVKRELHIIAFGVLRAPELQFLSSHLQDTAHTAFGIGSELLFQLQFWDIHLYLMTSLLGVHLSRKGKLSHFGLAGSLHQLQVVVLQIVHGHLYQLHVAGDATIVPPVEDLCGHILGMALVINLDHDGVLALNQQVADVEVESSKATHVVTSLLTIHPYMTVVVDGTKIQQGTALSHGHGLETLLKPYGSLVEEQALVLRVPVRRNLHRRRFIKIVLYQILWFLGFGIDKETVAHGVHTIVVIALFLHIHNVVPFAVQRAGLITLHILNQWQRFVSS